MFGFHADDFIILTKIRFKRFGWHVLWVMYIFIIIVAADIVACNWKSKSDLLLTDI